MDFPQIYVQALAGAMLALNWADTGVNKLNPKSKTQIQTQALSSVKIWCTRVAGSKSSDFILNPNDETLQFNSAETAQRQMRQTAEGGEHPALAGKYQEHSHTATAQASLLQINNSMP